MSKCPFSGAAIKPTTLTSSNGAPVANDNQSRTAGHAGRLLSTTIICLRSLRTSTASEFQSA